MKKTRTAEKIAALLATVVLLAGALAPMCLGAGPVVRVGYMDYAGFIDAHTDGSYTGYGAEYLTRIAAYTGYRFEYVYGEWGDLLQQLQDHEIDLLCTAQYTEERSEIYDYSAYPIGYTQGLLYTRQGNDALCYEDYTAFDGMTVGVLEGSAMTALFQRYAALHGFSCELQSYGGETELMAALESGAVDAMCSEHLARHTGLSLLAKFGADAYYIISYQDSPYMDSINMALQEIKTDVDFEGDLFHKYYDSSTAATALQFTAAERAYIASRGPVVVGLNASRAPFSSYDADSGTFSGICVDVLDAVAQRSGLTFQYVPQTVGATTPELLSSGAYDVICGVERDNFSTSQQIVATDAFLESSIVPVGRSGLALDMDGALTAAIPSSFQALKKQLEVNRPNLTLTFYKTNRECLDAVISGDADIFIQNTHILSQLLQEPRYGGLDILPVQMMTEHTAMALLRSGDGALLSILNKSIANVDEATINASLIRHTFATPYHYTTGDFLYKFRVQIVLTALLTALCFMLVLRVAAIRRGNAQRLEKKNKLLAEAVAQAEQANAAKSQFLSRMSHEIRTPMNAIVGLTAIAKQHEQDSAKVDDYLSKIETSSKVLLNIINDVLDMSAIENNKLKIASTEFDIKQVLGSITTIYYPQCQNKNIRFEMMTDLENELLIGDSLRVNQILMNLVSNAYKFTDSGGFIRVRVQETARRDETAFLRFTVEDSGYGMSPEMMSRLFKPFEQETADTARRHGGSGLGLSIAKNLVDMMHGAIRVESRQGEGTCFTVDLPFRVMAQKSHMTSETLRGIRVLTVDDDDASREYAAIVLGRIGVQFDMASSGAEALERLAAAEAEERPYDVCLIDWKMPDMDGVEVTRRIRQQERRKTLIIIVSAYDLNSVEDEAKAAGADHFVSKPLFQSTVFNVLMSLTDGQLREETAQPAAYDFTGRRVLLAEDNEVNAEIAMELLGLVHLTVERAENGQRAVELFSQAPAGTYDTILMDVQMPVLDGYGATRAIRALERPDAQTIPILAMTANAFTEDVSAALSAGMNGHIAKPIDTKVLYESIRRAIDKSVQTGTGTSAAPENMK